MKTIRREALFLVLLAVVGSAWYAMDKHNAKEHAQQHIVLTGSSTVAPLALAIGKRFETSHPNVRVDVQTGGSSRGIHDAREGLCDIGMASRNLEGGERDLIATPVARDGICLIVNASNPIADISDTDVVHIYTGQIRNWKDLGGTDAPITVLNKANGRGTLEMFLLYFHLDNAQIKADVIIGDNEQAIKTVAGNPNALGYVSIGTAEYDATHGTAIRLLPVGGVPATLENVRNGTFPLSRNLNLITREPPTGLIAEFIRYARSDAVHDLIAAQYFAALSP